MQRNLSTEELEACRSDLLNEIYSCLSDSPYVDDNKLAEEMKRFGLVDQELGACL